MNTWKSQIHFNEFPTTVVVADPQWIAKACEISSLVATDEPLADDEDVLYAQGILDEAGRLRDAIDAQRTKVKKPYFEAGKRIDETAKPLLTALDTAILQLKNKLITYKQKRDAELAAKLAAQSDDGRTPALDLSAAPESKIKTRKTQELRILNESLIPDEFWIVDRVALHNALLAGRKFPGVAELVTVESAVRG